MAAAMKVMSKKLTWTKTWSGRHQGPYLKWTLASVTINRHTLAATENWVAEAVDQNQTAMKAMKVMKAMKAMKAMQVMKAMKAKK